MKLHKWQVILGLGLIALSVLVYFIHYLFFHDAHHIFIYLVGDIAFVPIEVLLVTLIIHQLLSIREKRARLEKLNMVIGAFFSEAGTQLLSFLSDHDPAIVRLRDHLKPRANWTDREFQQVHSLLKGHDYAITGSRVDLERLRNFLMARRDFLLRLLENPNLLEHESFTELLQAVFHLTEEITGRETLIHLPETDLTHLSGDMKRVYHRLVGEWLDYMQHLKNHYPYLFSLAMRTNPFDRDASVVVE